MNELYALLAHHDYTAIPEGEYDEDIREAYNSLVPGASLYMFTLPELLTTLDIRMQAIGFELDEEIARVARKRFSAAQATGDAAQ